MDSKLTDLVALGTAPDSGDPLYIVDASDTSESLQGTSKQITFGTLTTNLVTLTGSQTLTNKTLTAPIISTISNTGTLTLPTSTDTLVGRATTDTLTNKTLTSPVLTTPDLGTPSALVGTNITGTAAGLSIGGNAATATSASTVTGFTPAGGTLTLAGADALTLSTLGTADITIPAVTDTVALLGTAQTYTATQTEKSVIWTNNAIAASSNAATVPITHRLSTVTNSSAATLTITMATASATDGQLTEVRVLDFSAVAQTLTWVNTENSTVTAPTTTNGSTTLPLSVLFQYNGATSLWRCLASA